MLQDLGEYELLSGRRACEYLYPNDLNTIIKLNTVFEEDSIFIGNKKKYKN